MSTVAGEWCLDTLGDSTHYTFGAEQISNRSDSAAIVTDLKLKNNKGFVVREAFVSPVRGGSLGVFTDWKGQKSELSRFEKLPPSSKRWLTLHLVAESGVDRASFDALILDYEVDGSAYTAKSSVGFVATSKRC